MSYSTYSCCIHSLFMRRNYNQLGLDFQLFSAEVLFNLGLTKIYLGRTEEGLDDLEDARQEKVTEAHDVIDEAIEDRAEGYSVFSVVNPPSCCLCKGLH